MEKRFPVGAIWSCVGGGWDESFANGQVRYTVFTQPPKQKGLNKVFVFVACV